MAYEILSAAQVEERWPALIRNDGWEGLFQPDTGILHADVCVAALQVGFYGVLDWFCTFLC